MKHFNPSVSATSLTVVVILSFAVFLSGCVNQSKPNGTLQYKNDVVTIEDYKVLDRKPYVGAFTTISFSIKNNGEFPLDRVRVKFDAPGFTIPSDGIGCEDTSAVQADGCLYQKDVGVGSIEPFDTRQITLTLQAPDVNIRQAQALTITYAIDYDYSGFRKADLPIIDGITRTKPIASYAESSQTYGPIALSFDQPVGSERVEGDTVIKEYWGTAKSPFSVKLKFTNVGTLPLSGVIPVIKAGKVEADLRGALAVAMIGGPRLACDLCSPGDEGCTGTDSSKMYSSKDIKIPGQIICNFQAADFQGPETTATLWVDYYYTYRFIKSETITIQPLPGGGTSGGSMTSVPGGSVTSTESTIDDSVIILP
jgi:hypothetical protein